MVEITVNIQNNADADTTPAITVPTAAPAITGPSRFLNIHLQGCSAEARVINVEVPLSATFALVRELAKVDPKFTFKIPNLAVTRELEGMLPLAMVPTPDITMEVPFVGHVVSKTAVRLPAYDEEGGQIKNYHYQYTFSKAEENEARVLVVIGESGTGKTTLLDTIVNYCLGIQEDDTVRYRLINESGIKNNEGCSKTDSCTEYHIERTPRNPPLLVIDTPGFGDTRGLKQDQIIAGQIREVFKKRTVIHSVCFVVKSSTTRL